MLSEEEERPPLPPPAESEVGEDEEPANEDAEEESDHVDDTTLVLGAGSDIAKESDVESEPGSEEENPPCGSDGFKGGEMVPPKDEIVVTPPSKRPRIEDPASAKKESIPVTWNHGTAVGKLFDKGSFNRFYLSLCWA